MQCECVRRAMCDSRFFPRAINKPRGTSVSIKILTNLAIIATVSSDSINLSYQCVSEQ